MRIRRPMALGILVLTADQLTKQLYKDADRVLLPGVLSLSGTRNTGAAFGLFGGGQGALGLVTGAIILGLLVYICARKPQAWGSGCGWRYPAPSATWQTGCCWAT